MPCKDFDLIVYGASGYTGRLVAEYLALTLPLQMQPKWKQHFGWKKEAWNGEEALFA